MLQARPPAMVVACGRLRWPWRCGGGGGGRVGTRLGLVSGGSMAYTKLGHATAVDTQNPGRVCPREPFQQQRNHASEAVQISLGWVKKGALVDTICSSELAAALGQPQRAPCAQPRALELWSVDRASSATIASVSAW